MSLRDTLDSDYAAVTRTPYPTSMVVVQEREHQPEERVPLNVWVVGVRYQHPHRTQNVEVDFIECDTGQRYTSTITNPGIWKHLTPGSKRRIMATVNGEMLEKVRVRS